MATVILEDGAESYTTKGGIVVTRRRREASYGQAIASYVDKLDERRGAVFSSNYEYPGRYTRWDTAVVDPPLGIGERPAILALWLASLLPIVRNTYEGLRTVSPALQEAARGIGMTPCQRLLRVELPNPKDYQALVAPFETRLASFARDMPTADRKDPESQVWRFVGLLTVLGLAATEASALRGAILSFAYCLGLGIPFLIFGLAFGRLAGALKWIRSHYLLIMRIGGALLICVGLLLVTGLWDQLTIQMRVWAGGFDVPL